MTSPNPSTGASTTTSTSAPSSRSPSTTAPPSIARGAAPRGLRARWAHDRLGLVVAALAGLLAVFFLIGGTVKLLGMETPNASTADFVRWGYPAWFRHVVGFLEAAGAVALLLPRVQAFGASLRFWGAGAIGASMAGAFATHLVYGETALMAGPLVLLLWAAGVGIAARPAWFPPARRTTFAPPAA